MSADITRSGNAGTLCAAARAYIDRLGFELVVADASKKPNARFFPHGASSATKRFDLLERALRATPNATLATRVGHHLVLDVDVRHGGDEALAKLLARFGPLPPTWTAETPSGGVHVWFKPLDFKPRGLLTKGVELLTGNRLVTLSPSERIGGRYRWTQHPLSTPLAPAPQWLISAAEPPPAPRRPERKSDDDPETREKRARGPTSRNWIRPSVATAATPRQCERLCWWFAASTSSRTWRCRYSLSGIRTAIRRGVNAISGEK